MQCAPDEAMKQGKASSGAHCIRFSRLFLRSLTSSSVASVLKPTGLFHEVLAFVV